MVKKAEKVICVFKKFIVSRDKEVFLKLYKQLVRPHLEYATCVWNPHFKMDITRIEQVQKRATKSIYGLEKLSYEEQLRSLNFRLGVTLP